ncbi:G-type lectin S-receptor-like serine/threonine-protein kinase LECRK3 [Magnolia sinica]|uniref:G-type lectin S-receptor-like serine/threonine-protein kinase LECRK3 n=1 Tax=Magnolia sinica TaxID=86752 RepID=UPI002657F8E4|nr:G-type lectin S-receptor-like serine/threonine-protein kinase LECRK3 [Magnolia sinica]
MPCVRLLLLFLPLSIVVVTAQTFRNVSLGSSLSTNDENPYWVSPSGEFSFGFYRLPNGDRFLLAIWFDKIPEKTVVWSANGDEPVQGGSKVELTTEGRLLLTDAQDEEIWRAESNNGTVASAAVLDTGNFVLRRTDSVIVWESFDVPTDTILPSQILGLGSQLSSHLTAKNYSKGRFQLRVQSDGNLVFYPVNLPTQSRYDAYWASDTVDSGYQLVFNTSGYIYFTQRNGSMFNLSNNGKMVSTKDFYHRATLDFDGVFRQYIYPKNHSSSGSWAESWSVVWYEPPNLCTAIRSEVGSGACGFNSYCKPDDDQRPSCECPPGYSYLDPNNTFGGCKQDFAPQSCDSGVEGLFELREMTSTDWPLSDFERYNPTNEDECRKACLSDCFCAVAIFRDGYCWKKKLPLSNGKMDPSVGGKALIKVSRGNFTLRPPPPPPSTGTEKNERRTLVLVLSVLLGSSVFLNFLFLSVALFAVFFSYHKKLLKTQPEQSTMGLNLRCFTYKELEEITDGFKEELGRGAFAIVYKGVLASNSQNFIAVKKLDMVLKEAEKGFRTEVILIGQTHHKNLVKLLGFCEEGSHRLLVYEFMRNGSLASFLFEGPRPSWNKRMQIAFGIARGLMYLHEECGSQIIHCDIKPQNILLDDSFTARISDFGISKLLKTNQSRTTTCVRGTKGYVAPEWFRNMPVTAKVDVYSFGVMLLEIICCRKNIKSEIEDDQNAVLTYWASDCYRAGRLDMLVEDDTEALDDMRRMDRVAMVALWCIQEDPSLRPSMKKVTQMLEGAVEVSVPPNPYSFISSIG